MFAKSYKAILSAKENSRHGGFFLRNKVIRGIIRIIMVFFEE